LIRSFFTIPACTHGRRSTHVLSESRILRTK
jgi:hypothetical protein